MDKQAGFLAVTGGKVWYEIVGRKKEIPLIVLHGGPGYPHDYLEPLESVANNREVIFYDQLGCGNSDKPEDTSLWNLERFVIELRQIIEFLDIEKYHLYGHSWGAVLAAEFSLTQPKGLVSLILSDPFLSSSLWEQDVQKLLAQLPIDLQEALKTSSPESEEYKKALDEYNRLFFYKLNTLPAAIEKANDKTSLEVYIEMWGPDEFHATGNLKDFDVTKRLSEISAPVLLLCGAYDDPSPQLLAYFQSLFPNAKMEVFEESGHFPMWTEKETYLQTIQHFLKMNK